MKNKPLHISQLMCQLRVKGPVILLESQMKDHPSSTQSYLAAQPKAWIKAYGDAITICEKGETRELNANPWEALREFQNKHNDWVFGFLGYDMKNYVEDLESINPALIHMPDLFFMVPELLIEIDQAGKIHPITGTLPKRIEKRAKNSTIRLSLKNIMEEKEYQELILKAKQDIYEGTYYEINISHPLVFDYSGDGWAIYQAMKKVGPVPFGCFAQIDDVTVCCSSPERFLARKENKVWSQPIKGTASRSGTADREAAIEQLRQSEKEQAENLMIVDLVRNDLSRIAKKNSVRVKNLFDIESFETVHQMVSTVECEVSEERGSLDIIKACFPMGSMTGAPKIAAMEAIEEYENYKRGLYSGAIGYFKPNGDFDFNVVIRTAIMQGEKLVYPVGGAITGDSDPKAEWEETLLKARALTNVSKKVLKPE